MDRIKLEPKTSELLSNTIAQIVRFCSKIEDIDCIYMNFGDGEEKTNGKTINLHFVTGPNYERKNPERTDSGYNSRRDLRWLDRLIADIKRMTGITISPYFNTCDNYHIGMMHRREEVACKELARSAILYHSPAAAYKHDGKTILRYYNIQNFVRESSNEDDDSIEKFEPPLIPKVKAKYQKPPIYGKKD